MAARYRKCFRAVKSNGSFKVAIKSIKTGKLTGYLGKGGLRVKSAARAETFPSKRIAYANAKGAGLHKGCPV